FKRCNAVSGGKRSKYSGVIELSDVIKQGIKEKFARLREMGIKLSWSQGITR
ncbi:unnamed protein product, partial [marine sediment metagenome]